jgi:hypothetical protein
MSEAVNLAKKSSEQPSWVYPLGAERAPTQRPN